MFGKLKESGFWVVSSSQWKLMFRGHDALYVALWKFRLRLMKPTLIASRLESVK